jgi:hypothetical protein
MERTKGSGVHCHNRWGAEKADISDAEGPKLIYLILPSRSQEK